MKYFPDVKTIYTRVYPKVSGRYR